MVHMRYVNLGQTPSGEAGVEVGSERYDELALSLCERYIGLLRGRLGPEPDGAWLAVRHLPHRMGETIEVVCYYDPKVSGAEEYAWRCSEEAPTRWEEEVGR